jgi:hypothetical protein
MMRRVTAFLLLLLLLPLACSRPAQDTPAAPAQVEATRGPVEGKATLTPGGGTAGDRLVLLITVRAASKVSVQLPLLTIEADRLGPFAVLEQTQGTDLPLGDGRRLFKQSLILDTFETGDLQLPPLTIAFTDSRGAPAIEGTLILPALDVHMASALGADESIARPMQAARPLPEAPMSPWWWLLVPGLAGAAMAFFIMARRGQVEAMIPLTAAQRARRDLSHLEAEGLLEQAKVDLYFQRVADIVRTYLEDRFHLHAPRATTREFLHDAERSAAIEQGHRTQLHELLHLADLVKFARHAPQDSVGHEAMRTARTFVDETEPQAVAEAAP